MKTSIKPYKEHFIHHNNRRMRGHDYKAPCMYHITFMKDAKAPPFSRLHISELKPDSVTAILSALGEIIEYKIQEFSVLNPHISVIEHIIMPDHVHMLIHVEQKLNKAVGNAIGGLKTGISNLWRARTNDNESTVFQLGFNDRILFPNRSVGAVITYIRHNPYRLAIRQQRPDFFRKQRNIFIGNREIQAYGNLFLLRNPFKYALVVHRHDSEIEFEKKKAICQYHAENGGVVVSAFISPREKEIRKIIENAGGKIILVHNCPFADRDKPARHDFELCCNGSLLLVSPIEFLNTPQAGQLSRAQCLSMNELAKAITLG